MKFYFRLAALIAISAVLIIACKKTDSLKNVNEPFDISAAKEWWYGDFIKSADYKGVDYSSVFAPLVKDGAVATKKYPSWRDGISFKIGRLEVVELPLIYNAPASVFPGSHRLSKTEKIRIAEASLRKILLVKNPDNSVIVRTITLIPSLEYAKQKNYDISNNTLENPDPEFSGWLVVKSWKETIINYWKIENGKRVKRMMIESKKQNTNQNRQNERGVMIQHLVCGLEPVEKIGRICVGEVIVGDQPGDPEECTEWYEYPYIDYEIVCIEVEDGSGGGGDVCGVGMSTEECFCMVYNIGCGDPDPDPDPDPEECSQIAVNNTLNSVSILSLNTKEAIETISESPTSITRKYKWKFAKVQPGAGSGITFYSHETGIQEKGADGFWRWTSFIHTSESQSGGALFWGATVNSLTSTPLMTNVEIGGPINTTVSIAAMQLDWGLKVTYSCGIATAEIYPNGISSNSWYTHEQ